MKHDKFCEDTDLGSGWVCICDIVAQVRDDEREQAARRVEVALDHNRPCTYDGEDCFCERGMAIYAARGGEQA